MNLFVRVSNILEPDQVRQNIRPNLGPYCLQRLSADHKGRDLIIDRADHMMNLAGTPCHHTSLIDHLTLHLHASVIC